MKVIDFITGESELRQRLPVIKPSRHEMIWNDSSFYPRRFRIGLYRFLRDNVPLLNACIWTWSRLAAAPGHFDIVGRVSETVSAKAREYLDEMMLGIYPFSFQRMAGAESFLPMLFDRLFTDGAFAGYVRLKSDMSGIERFDPVDPVLVGSIRDNRGGRRLVLITDDHEVTVDGNDFYYFGLNADIESGLGRSIMGAIPFVARIEQELVDDMSRSTHNAGYHRLHVKITPPEKLAGESDPAYVERVNEYFDETVGMIRDCRTEDNPVTWDNVSIEYIGPKNVQGVTHAWFLNHRAMVEEICGGTGLAPFMLGYSYGTTHNWAQFKYDLVMRQVISIQRQTARFLEWLGNIELALKGIEAVCRYQFDNSLTYLASDRAEIARGRIDSLLKLYQAGLVTREDAARLAGELI